VWLTSTESSREERWEITEEKSHNSQETGNRFLISKVVHGYIFPCCYSYLVIKQHWRTKKAMLLQKFPSNAGAVQFHINSRAGASCEVVEWGAEGRLKGRGWQWSREQAFLHSLISQSLHYSCGPRQASPAQTSPSRIRYSYLYFLLTFQIPLAWF